MEYFGKRFIDIVASCFLLILLSPLFFLISFLIFIFDGKPIIFRQKRIGLGGKPFTILKFRSMVVKEEEERKKMGDRSDSYRITKLGKFLRKTSVDELPQLINILKGDMSFIGPRPLPLWLKDKMLEDARAVYSCRPGMTGLAQVIDRSLKAGSGRWEEYNKTYCEKCSFWLDVWIVLKTIPALVFCKNVE